MTRCLELSLAALGPGIRESREAVATTARELGASPALADDARLCVSEAVTNVVRHAYADGGGTVEISVDHADDRLTVVVRDQGLGMCEPRGEGELSCGLRIIDALTERMSISSTPGHGTEVRMVFPLDRDATG